jgi:hypothetical protein
VTYSTFDPESTDVLRLNFVPDSITANGKPMTRVKTRAKILTQAGYVFDESNHVLQIHHQRARDIDIQGPAESAPPLYVTFDDPHLAAGTELDGPYPSGLIAWPRRQWEIGTPQGNFGTFNLVAVDPDAEQLEFSFVAPRVFAGVDVSNDGPAEASVTVRARGVPEVSIQLKPGELRRVRTAWKVPSSEVSLEIKNGQGLRFDNLAYLYP